MCVAWARQYSADPPNRLASRRGGGGAYYRDALTKAEQWIDAEMGREKEIIIFGGAEIYGLFLPMLRAIDATLIEASYPSSNATIFPESDWGNGWKIHLPKHTH